MPATITTVKPGAAKAGTSLTIIGTGFADTPSETKVYHRKHGAASWEAVDPANVVYVSATELTISIDDPDTDGWDKGLNDVGVSTSAGSTPDDELTQALYFYGAGAFAPDDVIKGALEEFYIEGLFMGHTHGAFDADFAVETSDIEVEQSLLPVRTIKSGEKYTIKVPLAEVSLEHIKEVWGISATIEDLGSGRRRLTFGGDTLIAEKSVMVVLPGRSGRKYYWFFYRCAVRGSGTLSWSKGDQVDLPIELTVLADTSRPAGDQVGFMEEVTVT
jgi:hypothetical protein